MARDERQISKRRFTVVGLVGGIGSGKSRVAEQFRQRGLWVISGDALGHEVLLDPKTRERVVKRFGTRILSKTGEIDRRELGAIVFADRAERLALEDLVFPAIRSRIQEEIAKADAGNHRLVVVDAAVLFEAGWDDLCDWVVYVDAPAEIRLKRLAEQRGWGREDVAARERAQFKLAEKARRARYRLENAGGLDRVAYEVDALLAKWGIDKR